MTATFNPYGLKAIGNLVGGTPVRDLFAIPGGISAAYGTNMYCGQPV